MGTMNEDFERIFILLGNFVLHLAGYVIEQTAHPKPTDFFCLVWRFVGKMSEVLKISKQGWPHTLESGS